MKKTNYKLEFWALFDEYSKATDYNEIIMFKKVFSAFCLDVFERDGIANYFYENKNSFSILDFIELLNNKYNLRVEMISNLSNLPTILPVYDSQIAENINLILYKIEFAWYDKIEEKMLSAVKQILNLYGVKYRLN